MRITGRQTIEVSHICPNCGDECGAKVVVEYQGPDFWDYRDFRCVGCGVALEITDVDEAKFAHYLDPVGAEMDEKQEQKLQEAER